MQHLEKSSNQVMSISIEQWISEQTDIHFALLFGSFASQTQHETSDIDLAVELKQPLTTDRKLNLLQSLLGLTDRTIDLVDLQTVGEPLLNEIEYWF